MVKKGQVFLRPDLAKNIHGKKSDGYFGVEMKGIKNDRGGKRIKEPQQQGDFLVFPILSGKKKNLKTQQNSPDRQAYFDYIDERPSMEMLAQPIIREHEHRNSRLADRPHIIRAFFAKSSVGSQPEIGIKLSWIKMEVIMVGIIFGQIDIPVLVQAVGRYEVIGFIPGVGQSLGHKAECQQMIHDEGNEKEDEEFLFQ
jgi:hypothetical protein